MIATHLDSLGLADAGSKPGFLWRLEHWLVSASMKAWTLDFTVSGTPGQPPHVINFLGENYPPKRAKFAAGNIIIHLKAGINAYFSVTDTLGNGAIPRPPNIGAS
ncbi:hypothetical protein FRB95_003192 [Tulasnella sp. JGI-2019a]|nr:hypothetical protein FRB95_003192 [Tulasnella sp. JGI-2019a]